MSDLSTRIDAELARSVDDLTALTAIRSVSSLPAHRDDVRRSAEFVRGLLDDAGAARSEIWQVDDGHPAVFAHWPAPAGMPTVCLYAHHDVQPAGDPSLWSIGDPFAAEVRDGRLYGRGVGDDKAGLIAHVLALRAFDGRPPIGIKVFVEGEEEIGSASIPPLLESHRDDLAADAWVILDAVNVAAGSPTLTTTLRGLAEVTFTVSTTSKALHSGVFGGVVPDAVTTLCKLLGTLVDDAGNVAVAGLVDGDDPGYDYPPAQLAAETGVLSGVAVYGSGSIAQRLWRKHSIAVLAIDAAPVAEVSNTLYPSARAKVGMRVPPSADPDESLTRLVEHLHAHVPFGAHLTIEETDTGRPFASDVDAPIAQGLRAAMSRAWDGVEPTLAGGGGSLPLAALFADAFPSTPVLLTGVLDPDSAMHAPDESVSLDEMRRAALAEALWWQDLATCHG